MSFKGQTVTKDFSGQDRRLIADFEEYFNTQFQAKPLPLGPQAALSSNHEQHMIVSSVGAGIAISIFDSHIKAGSMAHIILPQSLIDIFPHFTKADKSELQQVIQPIEDALSQLEKYGSLLTKLNVRLMGGAWLADDPEDKGTKNYVFVREYITRRGLAVMNEDMGGKHIRRVHFFPASGRMVRLVLRRASDIEDAIASEQRYQENLKGL